MNSEYINDVPTFLSYLQKRMDFIAQVATSAPSWCMVTSCNDLVDRFNQQYCLVKNIIRSHQGDKGGANFEPLFEKEYDTKHKRAGQTGTLGKKDECAPDLDIPHGQIGVQAFYTILENIVRNTAKYGDAKQLEQIKSPPGDGKLRFKITVTDRWEDRNGWAKDFYRLKIIDPLWTEQDPLKEEEGVVASLNGFLGELLTDPATGVVKPKHWGMKEIKICAAYLRMVKQDQIDEKFNDWDSGQDASQPPIIQVSLENTETRGGKHGGKLTYTLYLLRPKTAFVVMPAQEGAAASAKPLAPEAEEAFRLAGIEFHTPELFKAMVEQGESPRHRFLVLPRPANDDEWRWLAKHLDHLPPRLIVLDCKEEDIPPVESQEQFRNSLAFMGTPQITSPAYLKDKLWDTWQRRWWGNFEIVVRWSLHNDTVAEKGGKEGEFKDVPAEAKGRWIVFDHKSESDKTPLFQAAAYHEAIRDGEVTTVMLNKRPPVTEDERGTTEMIERQIRARIKEAAGLSVAIIDERAWLERGGAATRGVSKYTTNAALSRRKVWEKRRVFLQDTNLALNDFDKFISLLQPPDRRVFDFIIVHQGIIDGVKDRMGEAKFKDAWERLKKKARWLVVDSGRGQPDQALADGLRWVEYSNLAECLIQNAGDKFKLAELLWTLRASSRSGTVK